MKYKIFLIICLLITSFACKKYVKNDESTIVASVNNEVLTLEILQGSYGDDEWNSFSKDEQRNIINNWIDLTLLDNYAKQNDDINNDISLVFQSKNAEKKIYANALISNAINNIEISNDELFNYYRLRISEFVEQIREFRVQRIFLRTEADMLRVKRMLDNRDVNFLNAAMQFSEEGIGRNGGYMGTLVTKTGPDSLLWHELDKMERFFEVLMPYRNGFLIARWYEFRTATSNISFYDVRDEIDRILREEKRSIIYEQLLKEARMNAYIVKEF